MKKYFAPKGFTTYSGARMEGKTERSIACKFCGEPGLTWVFDAEQKRYRLYDASGQWHNCRSSFHNPQNRVK